MLALKCKNIQFGNCKKLSRLTKYEDYVLTIFFLYHCKELPDFVNPVIICMTTPLIICMTTPLIICMTTPLIFQTFIFSKKKYDQLVTFSIMQFIRLAIYICNYLSSQLSIYTTIYLQLSIQLAIYISIQLSIYLYICNYLSSQLSIYTTIYLASYLYIQLSIQLSMYNVCLSVYNYLSIYE